MLNKPLHIIKNEPREGPGLFELELIRFGVPFQLVDLKKGGKFPKPDETSALIVLGGPDSANDRTPRMRAELEQVKIAVEAGTPYLGICLGLQVLVKALGGTVTQSPVKEVGFRSPAGRVYEIELTMEGLKDPLFRGFTRRHARVFQLHGETVRLTKEMTLLGVSPEVPNQVVRVRPGAWGFQCHFELTDDLLAEWLREDEDLRKLSARQLCAEFKEIHEEYKMTGRRIIRNFLEFAGLLLPEPPAPDSRKTQKRV